MEVPRAEPVTPPVAQHGEGPAWWDRWGGLRFVDVAAGDVLSLGPDRSVRRRHVARVVAALRPRAKGGAVLALERGFALEDEEGTLTRLPELWRDPGIRMNDGGCDPQGRFYCGSMASDARPGAGALYRLDPDRTTRVVLEGVTISNGLEWSPDGTRAYYVDSPTQRIDVFDHDADLGLTRRRPFVLVPKDAGLPDGITVDAEGGVWVALYGGGAVRRYLPDGTLDLVVDVPARKPTACTFGGPRLDVLYVTTTQEGLAPGEDAMAGALFAARVGVRGLPARTFAG